MSDPLDKITEGKDLLGKIRNFMAGFIGYVDRENRRAADKILRETIAARYEEQWGRISEVQRQIIAEGKIDLVDDLEAAAIKLRGFIDRIKTGSYGYSSFFDAVSINSDELEKLYAYDAALLEGVEEISRAVDHVSASLDTDGLPAAIRNLTTLAQQAVDAYNQRDKAIMSTGA